MNEERKMITEYPLEGVSTYELTLVLDERGFFARTVPKQRYNQFGGTLGGPILKNRLFFFGSYQGARIRQDASATSAFPE